MAGHKFGNYAFQVYLKNTESSRKEQVLITYKTRAHAQLSVTLLPQAVSQITLLP